MKTILLLFLIATNFVFADQISKYKLEGSCHGIDHCVNCHEGKSKLFYICDQCEPGYGVDTKVVSSDLCVYCNSVIPNCVECSSPYLTEVWSCTRCQDGYELVIVPQHNDICIKTGSHLEEKLKFLGI
jgi:hypothetical protein